jgi:hypothetical protein
MNLTKNLTKKKYKYQWYQDIYEQIPAILKDAAQIGEALGLPQFKNQLGLYSGASSCPASLPDYVLDAIVEANHRPILPLRKVEDELREVVKDMYGDAYDAAVTNTCEASLRVAFETLCAPPTLRKGDAYRGRVICPYGEDYEWGAGYGRAFPPRYKNLSIDRTVTGGELGVEGKSLNNLDSVFVRYAGTTYDVHGVKQNVIPLMTRTSVDGTLENIRIACDRHASMLTGFHIVGYDTPGYGHGTHDADGVPILFKEIGQLAQFYDVPFIVDAASCLPGIGLSPQQINADVMMWSMDKAGRSPIAGLIVGTEESMVTIRKALGLGGQRYGEVSSHSKAVFSIADPGRDAVVGLTAFLKTLRDTPERVTAPIDRYHQIILEEFADMKPTRFRDKLIITKSYHMGGTELNYEQTWDEEEFGIPLFTLEDLYANTNAIDLAISAMGVSPATIYSGNMFLGPGLGLLNRQGELIEDYARLAVKALVKAVELVCNYAGLGD